MAAVLASSLDMSTSGRHGLASKSMAVSYNDHVASALTKHEYNFVMCDPALRDLPIVYASEGFCEMTEYSRDEIIGRNCRFLHGPDTDRRVVMEMRDAIREERPCQVKVLNYTKSGRPFWNLLHLAPIYSAETGRVVHYLGVQTPVFPTGGNGRPSGSPLPEARPAGSDTTGTTPPRDQRSASAAKEASGGVPRKGAAGRCCAAAAAAAPESVAPPGGPEAHAGQRGADVSSASPGDGAPGADGPAAGRLRGGGVDGESRGLEEVEPPVGDTEQKRAVRAVRGLLDDLSRASAGQVSAERCLEIADGAAKGVLCSSILMPLVRIQQSFVLVDPSLPDSPIVHASDVFLQMTGYDREEVVGRNCRFLQGPGTDAAAVAELREAVREERSVTVRLLNYRKDGSAFWNSLHIAPVRRCDGKVAFFCGVQLDVSAVGGGEPGADAKLKGRLKHMAAVGAVRVAVRGLHGHGLRRTLEPVTV